jgi:hypothetical protein
MPDTGDRPYDRLGLPTWCKVVAVAYRQHVPETDGKGVHVREVQEVHLIAILAALVMLLVGIKKNAHETWQGSEQGGGLCWSITAIMKEQKHEIKTRGGFLLWENAKVKIKSKEETRTRTQKKAHTHVVRRLLSIGIRAYNAPGGETQMDIWRMTFASGASLQKQPVVGPCRSCLYLAFVFSLIARSDTIVQNNLRMAQWIRGLPSEQETLGQSPGSESKYG